ncbi:MAG: T9SS type A sorting domain-containing protein [Crocinitomicaceae bacterium]|nr:T9SS type A sorting domain-containing protein [Crocinitomicaceae bacterium]
MKRLLFTIIVFHCLASNAQLTYFLKSYGNTGYDFGRDIKQTPDTGYIATGSSSSFVSGNADAFLLKIDELGNFMWSYNYGGNDSDWGNSVIVTNDSTYAIGGYTNSFGAGGFDFYLVRTDVNGIPIWQKTYGGSNWDKGESIAQVASDSGFVIVGETYSYGAGGKDMYIVRTNKNGDTIWTQTYGGTEDDWATAVLIDGDSIVICGGTKSYGSGMSDGVIIKMGLDGNIGWEKIAGMSNEDYFNTIIKQPTFYLAGGTRSYDYSNDKKDMWMYKISLTGALITDSLYADCIEDDEIEDLFVHPITGDVITAGYTKSWGVLDGYGDAFFSKFTSGFGFVTSVHYGSDGTDCAYAIDKTIDLGWIAIGDMSYGSTGGNNIFILKYNYLWEHIDIFTETQFDNITLAIDSEEGNSGQINLYPNPAYNEIYINSHLSIDFLELIDVSGKIIHQEKNPENKINIDGLSAGIYFINLYSGNQRNTFQIAVK